MQAKSLIIVPISMLLVVSIYSSFSISDVCAKTVYGKPQCQTDKNADGSTIKFCCRLVIDTDTETITEQCNKCTTSGGSTSCTASKTGSQLKLNEIFPDLLATGPSDTSNETKVPNTDLLTGESLVKSENDTDGDDFTKPPKDLGGLNDEDLPEPDQ